MSELRFTHPASDFWTVALYDGEFRAQIRKESAGRYRYAILTSGAPLESGEVRTLTVARARIDRAHAAVAPAFIAAGYTA